MKGKNKWLIAVPLAAALLPVAVRAGLLPPLVGDLLLAAAQAVLAEVKP